MRFFTRAALRAGIFAVSILVASCGEANRIGEIRTTQIVEAVDKDICYSSFWGLAKYRLDRKAVISIINQHASAQAWSYDLLNSKDPFYTEFDLKYYNDGAYVDSASSYNHNVFPKAGPAVRPTAVVSFRTPKSCTPHPRGATTKLGLLEHVTRYELIRIAKVDKKYRRKNITVVMANVDNWYPMSLVYIPVTNELFHVRCEPGANEYTGCPFGQEYNKDYISKLTPKLLKFGVKRVIQLN